MSAYYNEFEPYAAAWLRNLIAKGLIADGEVDSRSIVDVRPDDLRGYTQCHFFAGIGGWSYALRLAGWPDERPVWTGSCPCQPFSVAGQGKGAADARDLWPVWSALIRECRPPVVFGEQVAAAIGMHWLDRSRADMEGAGYAFGSAVLPACAVGAPHRRDRLWFVADAGSERRDGWEDAAARHDDGRTAAGWRQGAGGAFLRGEGDVADAADHAERRGERAPWSDGVAWLTGADGKARRVKSSVRGLVDGLPDDLADLRPDLLLAHGVPARVGKLRAFGNAIVPQAGTAFVEAYMECRP